MAAELIRKRIQVKDVFCGGAMITAYALTRYPTRTFDGGTLMVTSGDEYGAVRPIDLHKSTGVITLAQPVYEDELFRGKREATPLPALKSGDYIVVTSGMGYF